MKQTVENMPKDNIIVKDGKVVKIEEWTLWNGQHWPTIVIERENDQFRIQLSDPEHGGNTVRGSVDKILSCLHENFCGPLKQALTLTDATEEKLNKILPKYVVKFE